MMVAQWNFFSPSDMQSAIKRYEDELYNWALTIDGDIAVMRTQRERQNLLSDLLRFRTGDEDLVHATFQMLAPLKTMRRVPNFLLTVHDIAPKLWWGAAKRTRTMWGWIERSIPKADHIIANSAFTKGELATHLDIDPDIITVIHMGVGAEYRPYNKKEKDAARRHFGLDPEHKHLLVVASNEPFKNMRLIDKIVDSVKPHRVVKVGYGQPLENARVINLGYIPETKMPWLYNACDIYLHPSRYEGFGLPALEAMACGLPVLSSDIPASREVLGESAVYVPHWDALGPDGWAETVSAMVESRTICQDLAAEGIKRAKKLSWAETANKTMRLYEELA